MNDEKRTAKMIWEDHFGSQTAPDLTKSELGTILDGMESEALSTGQEEKRKEENYDRLYDQMLEMEKGRNLPMFERGPFDLIGPGACNPAGVEDVVNHPPHYTSHPSGVECIRITEHMGFNMGNALKYVWRADLKDNAIQDMEKAIFYIKREIALRSKS